LQLLNGTRIALYVLAFKIIEPKSISAPLFRGAFSRPDLLKISLLTLAYCLKVSY
jgi:hypothetical protein